MPGVRLAAVADRDPARCALVAPGVPTYPDAAALTGVDAVIVATPAATHLADATAVGVPSLVEKPPALTAAEARGLAGLASPVYVGFNRRFDPGVRRLRTVPRGDLELRFHYRRSAWAPITDRMDALLDLGPHLVDLARWLTGSDVLGVRADVLQANRFRLELELAGRRAVAEGAIDRRWLEEVSFAGAGRHRRGGLVRLRRSDALVASLAAQLEAFAASVRGGEPGDLATADDGVAVMEALEAAGESACSVS